MSLPALGTGLCLLTVQPLPSLTAHLSWIFAGIQVREWPEEGREGPVSLHPRGW